MSIQKAVLDHIEKALYAGLIYDYPEDDPSRAGIVIQGYLQGEPMEIDEARISISLFENDPDAVISPGTTSITNGWLDEVSFLECGGAITMKRRFTIKVRALLIETQEELLEAREIISDLRSRIEKILTGLSFSGVGTTDEYVARGVTSSAIQSEAIQMGGPPDNYDYHLKVRFDVETTRSIN